MPAPTSKPLPPVVKKLGWVSFFADICSEMAYPILPLFLTGVLKAPAAAIGNIEGIAESLVSFMKAFSGRWSDEKGTRLPFIRWGYALSAAGKPLIAIATTWPHVLGGRMLDRFGKGIRTTARDALIADATDPSAYGKAFGFHRAMDTAGAFVGVAIALALLYFLPGQYRLILALAVVPGILSVFLTFAVKEPPRHREALQDQDSGGYWQSISQLPARFWQALAVTSLFGLANTSDAFLLLRAKELSLLDWQTLALYMAYNAVVVLVATWAGSLSDRIGRWVVLFVSWLMYAGIYAGFAFGSANVLWILFAGYGLYYGMSHGVSRALVADHAPASFRGTAMGFFYLVTGLTTLAGNIAMGYIWDLGGSKTAFIAAGSVALLAALLIPISTLRVRKVSS